MCLRSSILRGLWRILLPVVSFSIAPAQVAQTEDRHEVVYHYLLQLRHCLLAVVTPSRGRQAVAV